MNKASAALEIPESNWPSRISLIEFVRAKPGTRSIMLPATTLSNSLINPKFKKTIEYIEISAPQILFIKNSFKDDLFKTIDKALVRIPIINAQMKSEVPPPNNTENVEVAMPAESSVILDE